MSRIVRAGRIVLFASIVLGAAPSGVGMLNTDIAICTSLTAQQDPAFVTDVDGSIFVVWEDYEDILSRNPDIYVQKYGPGGTALWQEGGINVTQRWYSSRDALLLCDGGGGVYVLCLDDSLFVPSCGEFPFDAFPLSRVTLMRLDQDGTVAWKKYVNPFMPSTWTEMVDETEPQLFPDGAGGAIVLWKAAEGFDARCYDIIIGYWGPTSVYAQRFDRDGDRLWGADPVPLCMQPGSQEDLHAAQTQSGSVIAVWVDGRYGTSGSDVFAQKVDPSGVAVWDQAGVPVVISGGDQVSPRVASDGGEGGVVAWLDDDDSNAHVRAQRIDRDGMPVWPGEGVSLSSAAGAKAELGVMPDGTGSHIAYWTGGQGEMFVQRLWPDGTCRWQTGGIQLSPASDPGSCSSVQSMSDGEGGMIFGWDWTATCRLKSCSLKDIWGSSENDIFAVGDWGLILHYDGDGWTLIDDRTIYPWTATMNYRGVWGTGPDDVYITASYGILHYDGSRLEWQSDLVGTNIWGTGPDDIFVTYNTRIYHYDGVSWSLMERDENTALAGIHGNSRDNIYAAGRNLHHYDGTTWRKVYEYNGLFHSVHVTASGEVFAGAFCAVLHGDGSTWEWLYFDQIEYRWPFGEAKDIWSDGEGNVYFLFINGTLARYDGENIELTHVATKTSGVGGIWGTSSSSIYVCGAPGLVRKFDGDRWETVYSNRRDVVLSRVDSTGAMLWGAEGTPVTSSLDIQNDLFMGSGGEGIASMIWKDSRNGTWDIYMRNISIGMGPLTSADVVSFDAGPGEGGIEISWAMRRFDGGEPFRICRMEDGTEEWSVILPTVSRRGLSFSFLDMDVETEYPYRYRIALSGDEGEQVLFETGTVSMPPPPMTLYRNFPNPFNPSTSIRFYLPVAGIVRLEIFDVRGARIAILVDGKLPQGFHTVTWDGRNNAGRVVSSGVYFYRLEAGTNSQTKKLVLMR
ncbi:MAG: T9SS type A sorting domain-containing protein [Candidatus Krumholzibacteria bacterium]|nr:T9SS type A sorting domain-containing protein [Candidatus Krumholzibacteria bacterium]